KQHALPIPLFQVFDIFFFSSRRRHTRSKRDWSSDVCSSDLGYLAALFIDVAYQNNGAGKELLNFEKRRRNKIRLKVYKENLSAVRFYEKNGFIIKEELTDEQTN